MEVWLMFETSDCREVNFGSDQSLQSQGHKLTIHMCIYAHYASVSFVLYDRISEIAGLDILFNYHLLHNDVSHA